MSDASVDWEALFCLGRGEVGSRDYLEYIFEKGSLPAKHPAAASRIYVSTPEERIDHILYKDKATGDRTAVAANYRDERGDRLAYIRLALDDPDEVMQGSRDTESFLYIRTTRIGERFVVAVRQLRNGYYRIASAYPVIEADYENMSEWKRSSAGHKRIYRKKGQPRD